jgi:hypothetical protein
LTSSQRYEKTWISPAVSWHQLERVVSIRVRAEGSELVRLVAAGMLPISAIVEEADACYLLAGDLIRVSLIRAALRGTAAATLWSDGLDCPASPHLHGMIFLPDSNEIRVLLGGSPLQPRLPWFPAQAQVEAVELLADHEAKTREDRRSLIPALPRPGPGIESIAKLLPVGIDLGRGDIGRTPGLNAVKRAIGSSRIPVSRGGDYQGLLAAEAESEALSSLLAWMPSGNATPAYPEVRMALERTRPRAFWRPRRRTRAEKPPDEGIWAEDLLEAGADTPMISVEGLDALGQEALDVLGAAMRAAGDGEQQLGRTEARKAIEKLGFEAFAWYQPFHIWTEESWGIYIDAKRLDDLTWSIQADLVAQGVGSLADAPIVALSLLYHHELFHARVEGALSWLELTSAGGRFRRYKTEVYRRTYLKPDCREEALANWWSRKSAGETLARVHRGQSPVIDEILTKVVDPHLDLSPPGYDQWRVGDERDTWQIFGSELCTGLRGGAVRGGPLPLGSLLRDPLPFELLPEDVPTWFVGTGRIADAVLSSPQFFLSPPRREMERALKHFGYTVKPSRGKGSHELWTGPDSRGFPLPYNDPVKPGIFRSFLAHFDVSKADYVRGIRPRL